MNKIKSTTGLKIDCIGELTFFDFEGNIFLNGVKYKVRAVLRKGWKYLNEVRDEEYELKIIEPEPDQLERLEGLEDEIKDKIVETLHLYQMTKNKPNN